MNTTTALWGAPKRPYQERLEEGVLVQLLSVVKENEIVTKESNASSCGQTTSSHFIYKPFSSSSVVQTNVGKNVSLWVNNAQWLQRHAFQLVKTTCNVIKSDSDYFTTQFGNCVMLKIFSIRAPGI